MQPCPGPLEPAATRVPQPVAPLLLRRRVVAVTWRYTCWAQAMLNGAETVVGMSSRRLEPYDVAEQTAASMAHQGCSTRVGREP